MQYTHDQKGISKQYLTCILNQAKKPKFSRGDMNDYNLKGEH